MSTAGIPNYLQDEKYCYPNGGLKRKGYCFLSFYDTARREYRNTGYCVRVHAGIPDTFWTIPAVAFIHGKRIKGYITAAEDGRYLFNIYLSN